MFDSNNNGGTFVPLKGDAWDFDEDPSTGGGSVKSPGAFGKHRFAFHKLNLLKHTPIMRMECELDNFSTNGASGTARRIPDGDPPRSVFSLRQNVLTVSLESVVDSVKGGQVTIAISATLTPAFFILTNPAVLGTSACFTVLL